MLWCYRHGFETFFALIKVYCSASTVEPFFHTWKLSCLKKFTFHFHIYKNIEFIIIENTYRDMTLTNNISKSLSRSSLKQPFCWVSACCDPIIYGPNFFIERRRSVSQSSWYDQCFTHDEESIVRLIGSRSPFQMGCKFVVNLFLLGLHSVSKYLFSLTFDYDLCYAICHKWLV